VLVIVNLILMALWTKYVENKGDFVQKWCFCTYWNNNVLFQWHILGTFWLTHVYCLYASEPASTWSLNLQEVWNTFRR